MGRREYREFNEIIKEDLKNPEFAVIYLNEVLSSGDKTSFLIALKDVIDAQGDVTDFAKAAHLARQNIYRMLSKDGNPTFDSLTSIFDALGIQMQLSLRAN